MWTSATKRTGDERVLASAERRERHLPRAIASRRLRQSFELTPAARGPTGRRGLPPDELALLDIRSRAASSDCLHFSPGFLVHLAASSGDPGLVELGVEQALASALLQTRTVLSSTFPARVGRAALRCSACRGGKGLALLAARLAGSGPARPDGGGRGAPALAASLLSRCSEKTATGTVLAQDPDSATRARTAASSSRLRALESRLGVSTPTASPSSAGGLGRRPVARRSDPASSPGVRACPGSIDCDRPLPPVPRGLRRPVGPVVLCSSHGARASRCRKPRWPRPLPSPHPRLSRRPSSGAGLRNWVFVRPRPRSGLVGLVE